jgi:hypothetical protein
MKWSPSDPDVAMRLLCSVRTSPLLLDSVVLSFVLARATSKLAPHHIVSTAASAPPNSSFPDEKWSGGFSIPAYSKATLKGTAGAPAAFLGRWKSPRSGQHRLLCGWFLGRQRISRCGQQRSLIKGKR